ncbi:hypothetical protein D3C72_2038940 [compost metagenome]
MRADLIEEKQARIDVQVAQTMHHPLGLLLAVFFDQSRHDGRVSGAYRRVWHVAEQQAVAVIEREPAVIGIGVAGA